MKQMPRSNDNPSEHNLEQFISDMNKVAQNPLFDPNISKQIRSAVKRIYIATPEEYEAIVRASTVQGVVSTPAVEQQITGYINNSHSTTYTDKDGVVNIAVKKEYLGSRLGREFGFDLLAEEVAHSIRATGVIGTLQNVPDDLWLFTMMGTTKDNIFKGIVDIIQTQNINLPLPSAQDDVVIAYKGFNYAIRNHSGQDYFVLSSGMYMEELRASILETIFLSLHLGNPGGNLRTPAMFNLINGANQIAARFNAGGEYSREMTSLNFIYRYLSVVSTDSERSQMLRTLITKLCTLNLDEFMNWLKTVNESSVEELTHLLTEIKNYKKDLLNDMFRDSEI